MHALFSLVRVTLCHIRKSKLSDLCLWIRALNASPSFQLEVKFLTLTFE